MKTSKIVLEKEDDDPAISTRENTPLTTPAAKAKTGLRFNVGKPPLELVPPEMIWAVAGVLDHGQKKYAARNWEKSMPWATVYACMFRHMLKWFAGEDKDNESGLPHLWHVLANAAFLVTYEARRIGTDDRPRVEKGEAK